jgi:hypothetical protein
VSITLSFCHLLGISNHPNQTSNANYYNEYRRYIHAAVLVIITLSSDSNLHAIIFRNFYNIIISNLVK